MLIYHCLRGDDERPRDFFDRELQKAFYFNNCLAKSKALLNIIGRRVLEKDCLQRGWVLLNFPHTLQDFKDIFETFKIPPNKLFYLKCSKKTCMLRLVNAPNLCKPSHNCTYFEHEACTFKIPFKTLNSNIKSTFRCISLIKIKKKLLNIC